MVAFLACGLWNSLTWITWPALRAPSALTGRAFLSLTHTHIHTAQRHTHTFQCSPLACDFSSRTLSPVWWCHQGLMRDYSDITGTAAKLNLLVSPCACSALRLELCVCLCSRVHVQYWGNCAVHECLHSVIIPPFFCPFLFTSEDGLYRPCPKLNAEASSPNKSLIGYY